MGLAERITQFFGKEKQNTDTLLAMLQPREIIGRGVRPADTSAFFAPYLHNFEQAAKSVYGELAIECLEQPLYIKHTLTQNGLNIYYESAPVVSSYTDGPKSEISTVIYAGILIIKQSPIINLEQAGQFMRKMLEFSFLAYSPTQKELQIFHYKKNKIISLGGSLLKNMDISLKDACGYVHLSGATGWSYVNLADSAEKKKS